MRPPRRNLRIDKEGPSHPERVAEPARRAAVDVDAVRPAGARHRHRQRLPGHEAAHDARGANRGTVQLGRGRARPETKDDVVAFGGEQEDFVSGRIMEGDERSLSGRGGSRDRADLQRGAREKTVPVAAAIRR